MYLQRSHYYLNICIYIYSKYNINKITFLLLLLWTSNVK